jgi:hypothetical protein
MRVDDDRPLPLSHLRTPVPLTDFDYAAVRARVRSELARRKERSWWVVAWRLAAVAMLVLLFIPRTREVAPPPVVFVQQAGGLKPAAPQVPVSAPERVAAVAAPRRRKPVRRHHQHQPETAVSRIEIHTADPDIRIIWIVPKENS